MTKTVAVDFGDRKQTIEVPDSAVIADFTDPPYLEDPVQAVRDVLAKPNGLPPLAQMARPGMRVAIGFDDITRPANAATTILPRIVEVLEAAGVDERDIVFINGCANHRKNTPAELANHLGPEIFERFWPRGQIVNHDCDDPAGLRYFGVTDSGRVVEHNKAFFDADLQIYQGNVAPQAWRGYTGTGAVIGLASTRSIASHHSLNAIPQNVAERSAQLSRPKPVGMKPEMSAFLEAATGKPVFYVNAITGTQGRLVDVFAGHASQITKPSWARAEQIFRCDVPQADILILGLSHSYAYGTSNNPLVATVGAMVPPRFSPGEHVLREGGVIIALSPSNGTIDPRSFPSYKEAVDLYGRYHDVKPLVNHEAEFGARPEFMHAYRHGFGYPAIHAFWIMYEMEYALERAAAIYIAGTTNPGAFRDLSMIPVADFQKAWHMARKHVGSSPQVVVAPSFWSRPRFKFSVQPAKVK